MPRIAVDTVIEVAAPFDVVWHAVVDEFTEVDRWAGPVQHSRPLPELEATFDGVTIEGRACTIKGFGDTRERVVELDRAAGRLWYEVESAGIPGFVHGLRNEWTLEPLGSTRTKVTSCVRADAAGALGLLAAPMLRLKLRGTVQAATRDLKRHVESVAQRPADLRG